MYLARDLREAVQARGRGVRGERIKTSIAWLFGQNRLVFEDRRIWCARRNLRELGQKDPVTAHASSPENGR